MTPILVAMGITAAVGFVIWVVWQTQKKAKANLQALAARLGLEWRDDRATSFSAGSVSGKISGRAVRFWTYTTGGGKSRRVWCAVGVRPGAAGRLEFEICRQGFGTKLLELLGVHEIEVGDPVFDKAWFIKTNEPDFLAAALVPEIRAKFMALPVTYPDGAFKLTEGEVRFAVDGSFASAAIIPILEARLPILCDLADVAEVAAARPA